MKDETKKTPGMLVLAAWLIVGLPLAWGVYNTWKGASKLFEAAPASTVPSITPAPATR